MAAFAAVSLYAQDVTAFGSYSPYSLFGIGDITAQGTAYNSMMGGIGIGDRNNRVINYLNPAAVTARDTLSFMMDFGLNWNNTLYKLPSNSTEKIESSQDACNIVNMNHIVATFPIYKKSAFIVGITPLSNVGYKMASGETSDEIIASVGDVIYQKNGSGSVYQAFVGAGVTLWDRLSLGAQGMFNFGTINRYSYVYFNSNSYNRTIKLGSTSALRGFSGKFGLQYEQPLGKNNSIVIGGTWRLASNLGGEVEDIVTAISGSATDTLNYVASDNAGILIPGEIGAGISYRHGNRWSAGFDYTYQDWSATKFAATPGVDFTPVSAQAFRAGFEYTPNRYDIRYYGKRITYRGGAYYDRSYYSIGGNRISSAGITFGVSLPVFRYYNAIQLSVDLGQRGALEKGFFKDDTGLLREFYANFRVSFSLHDIWFQKLLYN